MIKKILLGAALMMFATSAFTEDTKAPKPLVGDAAIEARQAAMKLVGQSAKAGDFDALHKAALAAQAAFVSDTTTDGTLETEASAEIWQDRAGFDKLMTQMIDLSAAKDRSVFGTCKACHKAYRN